MPTTSYSGSSSQSGVRFVSPRQQSAFEGALRQAPGLLAQVMSSLSSPEQFAASLDTIAGEPTEFSDIPDVMSPQVVKEMVGDIFGTAAARGQGAADRARDEVLARGFGSNSPQLAYLQNVLPAFYDAQAASDATRLRGQYVPGMRLQRAGLQTNVETQRSLDESRRRQLGLNFRAQNLADRSRAGSLLERLITPFPFGQSFSFSRQESPGITSFGGGGLQV